MKRDLTRPVKNSGGNNNNNNNSSGSSATNNNNNNNTSSAENTSSNAALPLAIVAVSKANTTASNSTTGIPTSTSSESLLDAAMLHHDHDHDHQEHDHDTTGNYNLKNSVSTEFLNHYYSNNNNHSHSDEHHGTVDEMQQRKQQIHQVTHAKGLFSAFGVPYKAFYPMQSTLVGLNPTQGYMAWNNFTRVPPNFKAHIKEFKQISALKGQQAQSTGSATATDAASKTTTASAADVYDTLKVPGVRYPNLFIRLVMLVLCFACVFGPAMGYSAVGALSSKYVVWFCSWH